MIVSQDSTEQFEAAGSRPPPDHADETIEQGGAFLASKADHLYSIEIFWIVMVEGTFQKTGLLRALGQLPKQPRLSPRDCGAFIDQAQIHPV